MDKERIDTLKKHIDDAEKSLFYALKTSLYEMFEKDDAVIEIPTNNGAQTVVSLTALARSLDNIRLEIMLQEDEQEED